VKSPYRKKERDARLQNKVALEEIFHSPEKPVPIFGGGSRCSYYTE
jgi:hypothetical protein